MKKKILVIGGTGNMGHDLVRKLLDAGHDVTILNRGMGKDDLPDSLPRLLADRTDPKQMRRALMAKSFDVVVDFVMHTERQAQVMLNLLQGEIDHYLFLSSGQVYLVREDIERPFRENEYQGLLRPEPKPKSYANTEWHYGMNKRGAEDVFAQAYADQRFPYTSLRLPMVNSERDPFNRLYNYILRVQDGGPILAPETPNLPLRQVYGHDVVNALYHLIETQQGIGEALNISQDETVTLDEFLSLLGGIMGKTPPLVRAKFSALQNHGFLPDCSPFSDKWMSELSNDASKALGITYTPLPQYLEALVKYYTSQKPPTPVGYKRRPAELDFARTTQRV